MKNYHVCFVGPIERSELDEKFPNGEGHIRASNKEAFARILGRYPDTCASGWGVTEEIQEEMRFAWNNHEMRKYIILSYIDEGKPFPTKMHEAYYLLLKKQNEI